MRILRQLSAETGTSKSGKIVRYYKCLGRKRGSSCKKSVLRKDILENLIVDTTCQILNNPETVNAVAEQIIAAHQKRLQDQSFLTILLKEQSDVRLTKNAEINPAFFDLQNYFLRKIALFVKI